MASQAVTLGVIERLKVRDFAGNICTAVPTCELQLPHVSAPLSVFVPYSAECFHPFSPTCVWVLRLQRKHSHTVLEAVAVITASVA